MSELSDATGKAHTGCNGDVSLWVAMGLNALPEHGTFRSFTDAELERIGVTEAIMRGFMQLVLMYLCEPTSSFSPTQEDHANAE